MNGNGIVRAGWFVVTLALAPLTSVDWSLAVEVGKEPNGEGALPRQLEILSPVYTVDREYRSMQGPQSTQVIELTDGDDDRLLWITGYAAEMVGADGVTRQPQEYMCHSNLDLDPVTHNSLFGSGRSLGGRLFTLSQGQFVIRFPDGFGLPLMSSEKLALTTQVLNLNPDGGETEVRHRIRLQYVEDGETGDTMQPLFVRAVYGMALLEGKDAYFGLDEQPARERHGPGCLVGESATSHEYRDSFGRRFTGHWIVPPGRQQNHTLVGSLLDLPFDTTVHAIAVHLHPFAESLTLRDLTTGETVFRSRTRPLEGRIGLSHVESYASQEGLRLYRDHEYELVSVYENPTDENHDAMAVMFLYLLDREFESPTLPTVAERCQ